MDMINECNFTVHIITVAFFHLIFCLGVLSLSGYINLHLSFNYGVSIVRTGHNLFDCPIDETINLEFSGLFLKANCAAENTLYIFYTSLFIYFSIF